MACLEVKRRLSRLSLRATARASPAHGETQARTGGVSCALRRRRLQSRTMHFKHRSGTCGRPSWLLSGASTALCLPRQGQLGRVFACAHGRFCTGSIPHSIPSLLHRAAHAEKPAGAYADKRGRSIFQTLRRFRAQMTLRGALNTRREDGGAALGACCAAGWRDLPRMSRSGVRSGRADSPERQTREFQLQRQRHRGMSS